MNNQRSQTTQRLGDWLNEVGIEPEKAVLWPQEPSLAKSLVEDAEAEKVVGLAPGGLSIPGRFDEVQVAYVDSHSYGEADFDLEYGWAIADDTINALEPQIEPEDNLHQYDYPDPDERDRALENAFSRIADTTDDLLREENAATVYNMDSFGRYELPNLAEDVVENQMSYAERLSDHLGDQGFDTEIIEDSGYLEKVHLVGRR